MDTSNDPPFRVIWGMGGHEHEYVIRIKGYDHNNYLPHEFADRLQEILTDAWLVSDRGSRLEVFEGVEPFTYKRRTFRTPFHDEVIKKAVLQVLEELGHLGPAH